MRGGALGSGMHEVPAPWEPRSVLGPALTSSLQQMAGDDPAMLRAELAKPEWERLFLDCLWVRLKAKTRDGMRLYAEARQLVGSRDDVLVLILREMAVRDKAHLGQLVERGKRLEQIEADATAGLPEFRDNAVRLLKLVKAHKPEWWDDIVRELNE